MTPFSPVRSPRLSEVIVRQIAQFVAAGRMQINDRFPSERTLETQWKVSRPVLREAFRALEMQGMIESRPGAGTWVRAEVPLGLEVVVLQDARRVSRR